MKSLKLILAATIFSLALSISSYAGDIGSPANPNQPPPATCTTCDQETSTEMIKPTDPVSPDSVCTTSEIATPTNFAVDIFLALLSFF